MTIPPEIAPYTHQYSNDQTKHDHNGPTVEALKRGISRLGYIKWKGLDFSQNWPSDGEFDRGWRQWQKDQGLAADGMYGEKANELIRKAVISSGSKKGQYALDSYACDLMYLESEESGESHRLLALDMAITQLGYKESPADSNNTKYGSWYGMNYQPWCAMFVTWCFEQVGDSPSFKQGSRYSYCPYVLNDAKAKKNGLSVTNTPIPGDLIVYDWAGDGVVDHIGIFEKGTPSFFTAIEGNTSTSNNSNGGQVMRRERSINDQETVFIRVAE